MSEAFDVEIRTLRSLYWSERDPEGRGFAPLVDAYRRAGDARQAFELLKDGLERHPDFVSGHVVAARLFLDNGLLDEAEQAARTALGLDAENVEALDSLAAVLEGKDVPDGASEVRARLLALEPERGAAPAPDPAVEADVVEAVEDMVEPELESAGLDVDVSGDAETAAPEDETATETADWDGSLDAFLIAPEGEEGRDASSDAAELAAGAAEEEAEAPVDVEPAAPEEVAGEPEGAADLPYLTMDEVAAELEDAVDLPYLTEEPEEAVEEAEAALEMDALAPDEPEAAVDLESLAPDETVDEPEDVMDLGALAPDEPEEEAAPEVAVDLAELAPEPEAEPPLEMDALAPDEPEAAVDLESLAPDGPPALEESVPTRTMAELYVEQGFLDRALDVYRHLLPESPSDRGLEDRIRELETLAAERTEDELETLARDLASTGRDEHEVDTPFAWTEEGVEEGADGPAMGDFFEDLFGWESEEEKGES